MGEPGVIRWSAPWACVLIAAFLSVAANADSFQPDSQTVPLPVLLDSLLSLSDNDHASRGARDVLLDMPWYSSAVHAEDKEDSAAREELQVTSVVKDEKYNFGSGVRKWHSLDVGSTTYLIGLGSPNVTLVTARFVTPDVGSGHTYSLTEQAFYVGGTPLAATLFKHWNARTKTLEAILVLSSDWQEGKLIWYRISDTGLDIIRDWPVNKKATYLKALQVQDRMKLVMLSPCESPLELVPCKASVYIYDFSLGGNLDPKLAQTLTLEEEAVSAEVGVVGEEIYLALALPTANIVKLYQYVWPLPSEMQGAGNHSIYGWFKFWKDLHSPQVAHAVFFHVSYKMYLAVGGGRPAVYRFVGPARMEGCPKALQNIGFVSTWLILPILSYRDEVVLLAEVHHTINSALFKGVVTLTWASAGVFNWQYQPQCIVDGKISSVEGVSCIIADTELGLGGAVAVQLGDSSVVSVLVPRELQPSSLYRIFAELQQVMNPLLAEVYLLREAQAKLMAQLASQAQEMARTEQLLLDSLNLNGPNIIKANWEITEIETPEFKDGGSVTISPPGMAPGDQTVKIEELQELMDQLQVSTKALRASLTDAAVPLNGEVHLSGYHALLGGVEVRNHSEFNHLSASWLNGESVRTLLKDVVRADRVEKINGKKTLSKLDIVNIDFATINDVSKDDLLFNVPDTPVRVHGNLEVTQILQVEGNVDLLPGGTVGGLDLSEEIFLPGKRFKGVVIFDEVTVEGNLTVNVINTVDMNPHRLKSYISGVQNLENDTYYDSLDVRGQLQVERINGLLWSDIAERIVWKDASEHIGGVTMINGILNSGNGLDMEHLNGLDFPNDFVWKTKDSQLITGRKLIREGLLADSLDISNSVDGVPVDAFVTLTTEQTLDGELKLKEADIEGDLKVDWAVNGIRLNQMHKSPLLSEGAVVTSNVVLSSLDVEGPIEIVSTLDARTFKEDIVNIVVLPSNSKDTVLISGKKTIQGTLKVEGGGINIQSGLMNEKKVSDIARLDTVLKFHGEKTIQRALFDNLELTGQWDGVNVVDLSAEAVRLTGIQDTRAHLTFTDSSKLFASRLVISEQINTLVEPANTPFNRLCDAGSVEDNNCVIKGPISANFTKVAGSVTIDGKVCGWDMLNFDTRRMSRSRPQNVVGGFTFGNFNVTSHIDLFSLNSIPIVSFKQTEVPDVSGYQGLEKLLSGGFAVDELYIDGNIYTEGGVNQLNLTLVAENAVKLVGGNTFSGSLTFEDVLTVGYLNVDGPVDRLDLPYLIQDAVLKNEFQPVTISGRKTFKAGFIVDGNIATRNLNSFDPSKIITKFSPIVKGSLRVLGSVSADNINVTGLLNGIPISSFLNRYNYLGDGRHLLKGNAHFLHGVAVDDLSVINSVQGVQLEQFFKSIVMKDEPSHISATKLFLNKVSFQVVTVNGLVNNMPLKELVKDVVLFNDGEPVTVHGRVTFVKSLTAPAGVSLSGNLDATELDGCLIKEWLDNAIYLNESTTILGVKKFSSMSSTSDLTVSALNAVDLSKVITLKTPQDISAKVNILAAGLRHNLKVDGRVNGKILQTEFDNTLMTTGNQVVTGSKTFLSGLTVKSNVKTRDYISGRNITNVVTLASDERINGPMKFSKMVIEGDLLVTGNVSNIDVQSWQQRAFLLNSPQPQLVTGTWDVEGQVRFMQSVSGRGLLDGENVNTLSETILQTKEWTRKAQEDVKDEWIHLCHDTDALLKKARAQPFLFQQLEVVQAIPSSQTISSMHAFEALNEQFLAVSYSDNCSGAMYRWNRHKTAWDLLDGAVQNIGSVERWATLRSADATYLITSAAPEHNCPYQGGNIWRFDSSIKFRNVRTMDSWHDAEVDREAGILHLLGRSGIHSWSLEDGEVKYLRNSSLPDVSLDRAQFVPRAAGLGLSVSDGKSVTVLEGSAGNTSLAQISRSANSNLPARSRRNVVTMKIADGRKLVAATAEGSDLLVVYEDIATGHVLARVQAHAAHSLSVMELTAMGRNGQTLLAFIENERQLRIVQYKGVEGFVDVTKAKLAVSVKDMFAVRLFTRSLVNQRHFLLLRSDHQVLSLEVEMSGDPLDELPLNCNLV